MIWWFNEEWLSKIDFRNLLGSILLLGNWSLLSSFFLVDWLFLFVIFDNMFQVCVTIGKSVAKERFLCTQKLLHFVFGLVLLGKRTISVLENSVNISRSRRFSLYIIVLWSFLDSWLSSRRFCLAYYFLSALDHLLVAVRVLQNISQLLYRPTITIVYRSITSWWFSANSLFIGIFSFVYQFHRDFIL